jgi:hypothetical protein
MNKLLQHILFLLIIAFPLDAEAFPEFNWQNSTEEKNNCECCAVNYSTGTSEEENDCFSCCCMNQKRDDMELTHRNLSYELDYSENVPVKFHVIPQNRPLSKKYNTLPIYITKNSSLFLQVILE